MLLVVVIIDLDLELEAGEAELELMVPAEAKGLRIFNSLLVIVEDLQRDRLGLVCVICLALPSLVFGAAHAHLERQHVLAYERWIRLVFFENAANHALARKLVQTTLGDGQHHELLPLETSDLEIKNGSVLRQLDDAGKVLDDLQFII